MQVVQIISAKVFGVGKKQSSKKLAKFIAYVLGRQPDEFGLVPDRDGYVKIKEFFKALSEEEGWRYVRKSHINEILLTLPDPTFEIHDDRIRAADRKHLPAPVKAEQLPKLLYTCVRNRAYPHVIEKGIAPMGHGQVIASTSRNMAERMGKRFDPSPVVLTVHAEKSLAHKVTFHSFGQTLYLTDHIPPECFKGPPLPKQPPEIRKKPEQTEKSDDVRPDLAGSYRVDLEKIKSKPRGKGQKKEIAWKKDRKRMRRDPQGNSRR